jgi:hypothetical protein
VGISKIPFLSEFAKEAIKHSIDVKVIISNTLWVGAEEVVSFLV